MRKKFIFFLIACFCCFSNGVRSQTTALNKADSVLNLFGEVYFKFSDPGKSLVEGLTKIISIDNYSEGEVYAYANREEFLKFLEKGIGYTVLPNPGSLLKPEEYNLGNWQKSPDNMTVWNFFPTYDQYVTFMNNCVTNYPAICKLDTIGKSNKGRLLLALRISDSINYERGVPQVFFTSSIHGDETTGYIMMLHLIDTLLNAYGSSTRITNMLKNTEIIINPLSNPDGTYRTGTPSPVRGNLFNVDMNRNYADPDPADGQHPDGKMWQTETVHFMNYSAKKHINLAMNFHGGAEVVNYPWDTWASPHLTADDSWWQFVSKEYADTAHKYGSAGYFTNPYASGYTNGYAWYTITGGRQDFHNYYRRIREVTLEISNTKNPAATTFLNYWKYNYHSFFNYIEQSKYGFNGKVYDSITGAPIAAKVYISGFDADSSWTYSTLPSGWYFRMIDFGTRSVTFSAPGYFSRTIAGVSTSRYSTNRLNVKLRPVDINFPRCLYANPVSGNQINISWSKNGSGNSVMLAFSTTGSFDVPTNGVIYAAGTVMPGGTVILYSGTETSFPHMYLDPNVKYYYRAWSILPGNTYSAPATVTATTPCGRGRTFPINETFTTATAQLPDCWTQEYTAADNIYFSNPWIRSNSNSAGGSAYEMRLQTNAVSSGTIRLITYSFNTTDVTSLAVTFKHRLTTSGTGATFSVQTSSDGTNWTNETWSYSSPSGTNSTTGPTTISVNVTHNMNSPSTMLAFVVTGNLSRVTNWYIDDVSIKAPGYWVGGTAGNLTNWNTAGNWGDGVIPTATTNVYIPWRQYLPVITNDVATPAQCNNLVISKDANISIPSGKKIQVNGDIIIR